MRVKRGTKPSMPGSDRQPSTPGSFSSINGSITGLISTVIGTASTSVGAGPPWSSARAPAAARARLSGMWKITSRFGTWTWGAARPMPGASAMVSTMSAISRRISGAFGSATGSATRFSTG